MDELLRFNGQLYKRVDEAKAEVDGLHASELTQISNEVKPLNKDLYELAAASSHLTNLIRSFYLGLEHPKASKDFSKSEFAKCEEAFKEVEKAYQAGVKAFDNIRKAAFKLVS